MLENARYGGSLSDEEALALVDAEEESLVDLCQVAAGMRDQGKGGIVTFSPKVFIPLTRLCRDYCGYCTFRQAPADAKSLYLTPEEVLAVASAGQKLGFVPVRKEGNMGNRPAREACRGQHMCFHYQNQRAEPVEHLQLRFRAALEERAEVSPQVKRILGHCSLVVEQVMHGDAHNVRLAICAAQHVLPLIPYGRSGLATWRIVVL